MFAAPSAADRTGSSAHVSYVRPHRLSRERSWTGAKSHTQPLARSAFPVAAPPASVADGSHVAPMPIDCGKSGACQGWPNPCTASTPKITGRCSREFWIAYFWIMLYSLAQSYPVLPVPPWPVVSGGLSVPPASSEPTLLSTSHVFRQLWFSWAQPWLPHALDGPVTLSTSCWSIWPTFSWSVIRWSRSLTRLWIDVF